MTTKQPHFVTVHILNIPYHADNGYTYYVPSDIGSDIKTGDFVTVPLGKGRRKETALVVSASDSCDIKNVKPVLAVGDSRLSLNEELLGLCFFMKEQTLCTVGEAVKVIVPSAAMTKLGEYYFCNPDMDVSDIEKMILRLGPRAGYLYNFVKSRGDTSLARIKGEFGDEAGDLLTSLVRASVLLKDFEIKKSSSDKYTYNISLAVSEEDALAISSGEAVNSMKIAKIRSLGQIAILRELALSGTAVAESVLLERTGATRTQITTLAEKNLVHVTKNDLYRNPYKDRGSEKERYNDLSPAQAEAYRQIEAFCGANEPKAVMFHGITGSGKTRVIKSAIDLVISKEKSVIILVPEISLTPQTVDIFCGYYGDSVAVIHSNLSAGERYDAWKRIRKGEVKVVIGTRSAVFAPLENIGLIVIDEEQEHTYKSDTNPKYLTHDIARFRCASHNALMLLSSATPSLSSYYKAVSGTYHLVELNERYGSAELPEVVISDMREEVKNGNPSPISEELLLSLKTVSDAKKQSILFLNRRGYNSFLSCRMCGEVVQCPHCSVSLTYHTRRYFSEDDLNKGMTAAELKSMNGSLACHYCGYRSPVPDVCPKCGEKHLAYMGFGTQYAEQELKRLVPACEIIRMDADTTNTKFAHEEILSKFRAGDANVLLGTQMVTKGHDFPTVTLVGVFLADSSLYIDDFRAAERTFAMITQVIGRAGRASDKGRAIIQTFNPDSDIIKLAASQNYKEFYKNEIELRRALTFPPFCDIAVITISGTNEATLALASSKLAGTIRDYLANDFGDVATIAFGPFEAPIYKIQNRYRMRMILKCKLNKRSRQLLSTIYSKFDTNKLSISIDLNPSNI